MVRQILAGTPDVQSRPTGFLALKLCAKIQPLEMKLESTPVFSHLEVRAACSHFFDVRFGRICPMAFLNSSSVAAFRSSNSDGRNEVCFAASRQAREIIAPEAHHSHAAFLNIRPNSSSEGDGCMKDTNHPIRHRFPRRHSTDFRKSPEAGRDCTWSNDQFGRGRKNTGLGWSDPTFYCTFPCPGNSWGRSSPTAR